jgi:hypothetical protein
MAAPLGMIGRSNTIKWEDMPDRGKKFVAQQLASPALVARLSKDWQDGISAFNKK